MAYYALDSTPKVDWTATQEKLISRDHPFDLSQDTIDQHVTRTYLQFLWFPESIMPLNLLVPCLQRVNDSATSSSPHLLHSFLEPLLLTARSAAKKYQVELPRILSDGGGADEIEETVMWYALTYEKVDDSHGARSNAIDHSAELWVDEKWRQIWLDRMERREVQIQILLYFLKLSLPDPPPASPHNKRRSEDSENSAHSPQDCLEGFMDKLSMWQLMDKLDTVPKPTRTSKGLVEDRDWMQLFCEEIVEPQFNLQLPNVCNLLRTKVFPSSPFSDSDDALTHSSSRSPSPDLVSRPKRDKSMLIPSTRRASPTLSRTGLQSLVRSRSRSLSVSLAMERESQRGGSVGTGMPTKKRLLNREVSMSRVCKPRPKAPDGLKVAAIEKLKVTRRVDIQKNGNSIVKYVNKDEGVTLVAATPAKLKGGSNLRYKSTGGGPKLASLDEEVWHLPGSADIILFGGAGGTTSGGGVNRTSEDDGHDSEGDVLVVATPIKRPGAPRAG